MSKLVKGLSIASFIKFKIPKTIFVAGFKEILQQVNGKVDKYCRYDKFLEPKRIQSHAFSYLFFWS